MREERARSLIVLGRNLRLDWIIRFGFSPLNQSSAAICIHVANPDSSPLIHRRLGTWMLRARTGRRALDIRWQQCQPRAFIHPGFSHSILGLWTLYTTTIILFFAPPVN